MRLSLPASPRDHLSLVLGVAATALMALFLAQNLEVTTEMTDLLPSVDDRRLASIASGLAQSDLSRTMILTVGGATPAAVHDAARELAAELAKDAEVAAIEAGPSAAIADAFADTYQPHGLQLLSDQPEIELAAELTPGGLQRAAKNLKLQLNSPMALLVKQTAPADPLLGFVGLLGTLERAQPAGLVGDDGQFRSQDRQRAVLFLRTRHSAMDAATQAPLLHNIEATFQTIQQRHSGRLDLQQSGINRFAVASRRSIESDIARISTVSTLALVALFWALFRSSWLLFLAQLPISFAILCATAATQLVFGKIHGLTLAFGSTLIGVCIDYPIHYLTHQALLPHPTGPKANLRQLWTGLWLGAATTVAGFACLGWSSFQGIRQVAVFASVGVTAALLATRWWLPLLVPSVPKHVPMQHKAAQWLDRIMRRLAQRRWLLLAMLAAAAAIGLAGLPSLQWNDDLSALNALEPQLKAEDDAVRAQVSALEPGKLVVVTAPDLETALQRNDKLALQLAKAQDQGAIAGFRSLHTFVWSADLQRRNREQLRKNPQFLFDFAQAFGDEGFRIEPFGPFMAACVLPSPSALTPVALQNTPLQALLRPFVTRLGQEPAILTFLSDVRDAAALTAALAPVEGATFFDQKAFVNRAYAEYRATTWTLVLVGIFAVLLLVLLQYRSFTRTTIACMPAVIAGGATLGLLSLCGVSLNLLHLVGFVIVLCIGVDYGVYLAETADRPESEPATVLSVVTSSLSAVLGFGLLALSTNPVMRAIGLSTGIGVLLSLLLAPTLLLLTKPRPLARVSAKEAISP